MKTGKSVLPSVFLWVAGILLFIGNSSASPKLKRICISRGSVNTVYWEPFKDTCQKQLAVYIYARENDLSPFKVIDSVKVSDQYSYDHINASNYQRGSYFLKYIIKCGGEQSVFSDTLLVDVIPPDVIDPDSVSVDKNGNVFIGWSPESSKDTWYYVIYRTSSGGINTPIDSNYGKFNTFFKDPLGKPGSGTERYRLATSDSCGNIAAIGGTHQSIFLQLSMDTCKEVLNLQWTPYVGWSVDHYDIFVSTDTAKGYYRLVQTVNTNYTLTGLNRDTRYFYFIRAYKKGGKYSSSSSNRVNVFTSFEPKLAYIYIRKVRAAGNAIEVSWAASTLSNVKTFQVYRGKVPGMMQLLAEVVPGQWSYTDAAADAHHEIWYYRINAISTCDKAMGNSNISNNIVLNLKNYGEKRVLTWNEYNSWGGGVSHYDIYKESNISNQIPLVLIGSVDHSAVLQFYDSDTMSGYKLPGICYYVQAVEGPGDSLGFNELSESNSVCYVGAPVVYIPNAFKPDGLNKVFAPVLSNVNEEQSVIKIYDRWGELVYSSNHPSYGWNGMKNGREVSDGLYIYILEIKGLDNSVLTYKGTVTRM